MISCDFLVSRTEGVQRSTVSTCLNLFSTLRSFRSAFYHVLLGKIQEPIHVGPTRIPCIIHQTWKTHTLPAPQSSYAETWQTMNPMCEYRLWNDTEIALLAEEKSPDLIWPIWDGFTPVEKADVFRYLVLWAYGGY